MDLKRTKLMKEKIFIKTNRRGYIPYIGMQGPIITPIPITREDAHNMIVAGIEVYQIDPKTKNAIKLTLQTVYPGEGEPEGNTDKTPPINNGKLAEVTGDPIKPMKLSGIPVDNIPPIQEYELEDPEDTTPLHTEDDNTPVFNEGSGLEKNDELSSPDINNEVGTSDSEVFNSRNNKRKSKKRR